MKATIQRAHYNSFLLSSGSCANDLRRLVKSVTLFDSSGHSNTVGFQAAGPKGSLKSEVWLHRDMVRLNLREHDAETDPHPNFQTSGIRET